MSGRAYMQACRVATITNITLFGEQTIDTVAVVEDDRVLVNAQTLARQNGIYLAKSGAPWVRVLEMDTSADLLYGAVIPVREPVAALYVLETPAPITIDTTDIHFASVGDASGGSGGDFDPSEIDAIPGVVYVDSATQVATIDRTGSSAAPFGTIAAALAYIVANPSRSRWVIEVAPGATGGSYSESLGFDIQIASIHLRGLAIDGFALTGSHSVTFGNSGYTLTLENGSTAGSTFTVVDGSVPASSNPGRIFFLNINSPRVVQGSATSVVNVFHHATRGVVNASEAGGLQCNSRAMSVLGTLNFKGVKVGVAGGTASITREFSCSGISVENCVVEADVIITQSGIGGSLRACRFGGVATFVYSGSAGTLSMDAATMGSFIGTAGVVTNGSRSSMDGNFTYDGPNAAGVGTEDTLLVDSRRPATVGNQSQRSPVQWWAGNVWDTDNAVTRIVRMGVQTRPIPGATVSAILQFLLHIDGTPTDVPLAVGSDGTLRLPYPGALQKTVMQGTRLAGTTFPIVVVDGDSGSTIIAGSGDGSGTSGGVFIGDQYAMGGSSVADFPSYFNANSNWVRTHVSNSGTFDRINHDNGWMTNENASVGTPVMYGAAYYSIGTAYDGSQSRSVQAGWQVVPIAGNPPRLIHRMVKAISGTATATPFEVTGEGDVSARFLHAIGAALGNANATITQAQGSVRHLPAATLTANREYTLSVTGALADDTWTIARFDATAFDADVINAGPSGGTTPLLTGYTYGFRFDGSGDWVKVWREKHP